MVLRPDGVFENRSQKNRNAGRQRLRSDLGKPARLKWLEALRPRSASVG